MSWIGWRIARQMSLVRGSGWKNGRQMSLVKFFFLSEQFADASCDTADKRDAGSLIVSPSVSKNESKIFHF